MFDSIVNITAQKMKFSLKDFLSKGYLIRSFLWIWSHLLKKFLMENFVFCAVYALNSKYARILNMLGLDTVLNKILHNRYLTGFWICLEFWICQCYTGSCRKRHIIYVWQGFEYSSDSQYAIAWICKGCEYAKVTQGSAWTVF